EETGGHSYDPFTEFDHTEYELVIQQAIRAAYIMKDAFLPAGAFSCNPPLTYETIDQIWKIAEEPSLRIRREWMDRDAILEQDLDNIYCSIDEHGHFGHVETIYQCDFAEPKGEPTGITIKGMTEGTRLYLGNGYMSFPEDVKKAVMYAQYLGKINQMLDINLVADSMMAPMFGMMGSLDELDELGDQEKQSTTA
ncbi:MAG: hypothetical protein JW738_05980, partial [Actinobacteria bacterium]|nr:hypothetical protein [Actinomycetota bacterium]